MATLKTQPTDASVQTFLNGLKSEAVRADCMSLIDLMQKATGAEPKMWGPAIIGFGSYHYVYASGREGDWMLTGFSPRKQNLVLYIMPGVQAYPALLAELGPHTTGQSCLYLKRLSDIHLPTLRKLVKTSVKNLAKTQKAAKAVAAERKTRRS